MSKVRSALVARIVLAPAIMVEAKISVENVAFTPPEKGTWIECYFMPATSVVNTLGTGGLDEETGFLQVTVCEPAGQGIGKSSKIAASLKARFYAGLVLQYEDQAVSVTRIEQAPSFTSSLTYKTPISIYWKAKVQRPTS